MPPSESDLLGLIGLIYDTTENPALWSTFLQRYAVAFAVDVVVVQRHCPGERSSRTIAAFGIDTPFTASYHGFSSRLNIWQAHDRSRPASGRAGVAEPLRPRAPLLRTELYSDYLVPIGAVHCAAGVVAGEGADAGGDARAPESAIRRG